MTLMPALAAILLAGRGVGERETRLVHWLRRRLHAGAAMAPSVTPP